MGDGRAGPPIRFGTSGWRGILGEGVSFDRARVVAGAVVAWARASSPAPRILVAHDTRFLADSIAASLARVVAAAGGRALLVEGPVPTPVATHAVRRRHCAAGLVVTASHNPPEYCGIKVVMPWGAGAPSEVTRALERVCARLAVPPEAESAGRRVHPLGAYRADLARRIDTGAIRGARLHVAYDALHGTGAGVVDRFLGAAGARLERLRCEPDPAFGGGAPDPTPARLEPLRRCLRRGPASLGLATDGDADRFAVVDAGGRILSETESVALLVDHLARSRKLRGGVALSIATGTLVERVAREAGLEVERHPIGFKWLSAALRDGRAEIAGEESGGFAWAPFARDKDAVLACALVAEMAACARGPLAGRLAALERRFGALRCSRRALAASPRRLAGLRRLHRAPPARFDGSAARASLRYGALRLDLDDGFAVLRASGTEPVVRVYAEAPDRERLARRLDAAARLLERAGR